MTDEDSAATELAERLRRKRESAPSVTKDEAYAQQARSLAGETAPRSGRWAPPDER